MSASVSFNSCDGMAYRLVSASSPCEMEHHPATNVGKLDNPVYLELLSVWYFAANSLSGSVHIMANPRFSDIIS